MDKVFICYLLLNQLLYFTHWYVKDIAIHEKLFYVCELMNVEGLYLIKFLLYLQIKFKGYFFVIYLQIKTDSKLFSLD